MDRTLRGHHLLCVHGFRGMGYSPGFVENMAEIVEDIRNDRKQFRIKAVADFDHACQACPHKGKVICEASEGSNAHVLSMDAKVIEHLGIEKNREYDKHLLLSLTAAKVHPDDLDYLCEGCSWLPYGVCKEGIGLLKEKYRHESKS
ncbi:DUF1284 domain-containing protein [Bacillus infantis]|uniref:DUF1284 domain-containing protein n=1 Tax=Bacillus infantis TaxID=324767 RepID=UPI003CF195CB